MASSQNESDFNTTKVLPELVRVTVARTCKVQMPFNKMGESNRCLFIESLPFFKIVWQLIFLVIVQK
ncbi:2297_t:CDS:2, partial [Acaulospora morrowiae]